MHWLKPEPKQIERCRSISPRFALHLGALINGPARERQRRHRVDSKESIMTIVKAAAVQISPVLYSREGTVRRVVQKILELGKLGVQFATFPETVVPYYPY